MIGFPRVASFAYNDHLDWHNVRYRVAPVSMLVQQQRAKLDLQGYPKHVMIDEQLPEGGHGPE